MGVGLLLFRSETTIYREVMHHLKNTTKQTHRRCAPRNCRPRRADIAKSWSPRRTCS